MTSTRRDLPVPDEALIALAQWDAGTPAPHVERGHLPTVVRAIASPVVAAVLSDIADRMDADGMTEAAGWLRVRADEYGGGE